jgi:uncharacterized repeat protein (TIGR03803 family)
MSHNAEQLPSHTSIFPPAEAETQLSAAMLPLMLLNCLLLLFAPLSSAQTYQVIHTFSGPGDGWYPHSGLTIDTAGNIYGTTSYGGPAKFGLVYRLSPRNSGWVLRPLDQFPTSYYGKKPEGGLVRDASGALYGTTQYGGTGGGLVYKLAPTPSILSAVISPWTETILHRFTGEVDGRWPYGPLVFDSAGNLFGTTSSGALGYGTVYQLTPSGSGWTLNAIYSFAGGSDGSGPAYNLLVDTTGNIYGTTLGGGEYGCGTVFELSPVGEAWIETVLHSFSGHGCGPIEGLIMDEAGGLYGATFMFDNTDSTFHATVYHLSKDNGNWTFGVISEPSVENPSYLCYPEPVTGTLAMDAAGNLYGTMQAAGAYGFGSIFKLTRSNDTWTYSSLHDFNYDTEQIVDVCTGVVLNVDGTIYGTAEGGVHGGGVVWKVAP